MKSNCKKVAIILVNYKNYTDTIQCIYSLLKLQYENYEIVVIDNGSNNNSLEEISKVYPYIKLIDSGNNLGFAGANNIGIQYTVKNGADFILMLNNDTTVDPDFLNKMVENFSNDETVGIVGSKIMYYDNKKIIWFAGGKIDWLKFRVNHFGEKQLDSYEYNQKKEVDFITGCVMLIKKEVIEKIGLLSNEYFMYYEDVDFCVRAKEAGFKIIYEPKAIVYHKVSVASGGEDSPFTIRWNTRNKIIFMCKFRNKVSFISYIVSFVGINLSNFKKYITYILKHDRDRAKAIVYGEKEGYLYIKSYKHKLTNKK